MLTIKERSLIFMGDFFLLFIIFIVESYAYGLNWIVLIIIAVPLIGISMVGLLYLSSLLRNRQKFGIEKREIKSIDDRTNLYVIYMMTFISLLPLFLGRNWLIQSIAFFIIMLIIYSIYINSDLLFYNPVLGLLGYKYYKVTTPDGSEIFVIASRNKKIKVNDNIEFFMVTDYIFLFL